MTQCTIVCYAVDTAHLLQCSIDSLHTLHGWYIIDIVDLEEPEEEVELSLGENRTWKMHKYVQCARLKICVERPQYMIRKVCARFYQATETNDVMFVRGHELVRACVVVRMNALRRRQLYNERIE